MSSSPRQAALPDRAFRWALPAGRGPKVKICCMGSVAEAQLAVRLGADALGLVSAMPSGPGPITDELIAEIAAAVPPPVATFLLTCLQDVRAIVAQQRRCGATTLQLVDRLEQRVPRQRGGGLSGFGLRQRDRIEIALEANNRRRWEGRRVLGASDERAIAKDEQTEREKP